MMGGPLSDWLHAAADGSLVLNLHIQPGAKQTGFAGLHGEAMKVRLAAPPVDGKANAALCAFLADFCALPKSAVTLISGQSSRTKRVRVDGAQPGVIERLEMQAREHLDQR